MWNRSKLLAYLKIGRYEKIAAIIIAMAACVRLVLISQNWPVTNSDESTMGLMALHIANRGEHPVFFYGQHYMGSLEAFCAAGLFHLFGPSTFMLRCVLVIFFILFLVSIYLLASLLYSKKLALVTLLLLGAGSDAMIGQELFAIGGYPDTLLFGTLILLLASWLALSSTPETISVRRSLVFGGWGLAAGLGLWSDLLILPLVLIAGWLLVIGCWCEWRTWAIPAVIVGFVVGALPLLYYNLHAQPGQDSLSVLLTIHQVDKSAHLPVINQLIGSFLISLPTMTGVNPSCPVISGQQIGFDTAHHFRCFVEYASWSTGYTALWIFAVCIAIAALWVLFRQYRFSRWPEEQRHSAMLHVARLALLASAGLTMLLYAISPNAAEWPQSNSRYLIALLIAIPAVIYPLWIENMPRSVAARLFAAARGTLLTLIVILLIIGTVRIFPLIPKAQVALQQRQTLITVLQRMRVKHIYSDYWTCSNVIFESNEQIICAEYQDSHRYQPYIDTVKSDPHAIYVLPDGSYQADNMAKQFTQHPDRYQHSTFDGYQIYTPI
jgi:hypothetical protein